MSLIVIFTVSTRNKYIFKQFISKLNTVDSLFSYSQFSQNSQFSNIFAAYQLDVYCY